MNLQSISFSRNSARPLARTEELTVDAIVAARTSLDHPIAHVVCCRDLDAIKNSALFAHFDNRGSQDKVELSRKLLGRKRIPFVTTCYSVRGRLIRAITDLITRASDRNERNAYVIGVPETLFADLWAHAAKLAEARKAADGSGPAEPWEIIYERLKHQRIPVSLRDHYIGISKRAELVRHLIVRAAQSDANVLILGETGTGKEIIARWIHALSPRAFGHFEAVNCAGIPEKLFESELFGHTKGAYTDAKFAKVGKWTMANNGTLFLDEVGDLSREHQAKLLRALEDGEITPVGGVQPTKVNARVIAATNRNLKEMVDLGTFRRDLLFRLRTFLIPVPSLHEHTEDVAPISNYLWRKITRDDKAVLPDDVVGELSRRRFWPGNAREIKAVLTCVHALVGKDEIDADILRAVLDQQGGVRADAR